MYKKVLGTIISFCLVLQMPLTAYADETINEKQTFADGGNHSVNADISVITEGNDYAVSVSNNTSVTINGNVESDDRALYVNSGTVTVNGDIIAPVPAPANGVDIIAGSVTVNGSIKGYGSIDKINSNSSLTVNNGSIDGMVMIAGENGTLIVTNGNVYDRVTFTGNTTSANKAIVNGNVHCVSILGPAYANGLSDSNYESILSNMPEVIIYSADNFGSYDSYVGDSEETEALRRRLSSDLNDRVNYIVRLSDNATSNVTVSGYSMKEGYKTATPGTALTVTPVVDIEDGYELVVTAGRWATVTKNEDGTYTINVAKMGGLTIDATIREIIRAIESGSVSVDSGETAVVEIDGYRDPSKAPAGAIVVSTGAISDAGPSSELAPIANVADAVIPARAVSYQINNITPYQYINSVIENAEATPTGETLRISVDRVSCFNFRQMKAFSDNGIGVELIYIGNGQRKRIRIPAGFDLDSFAKNENGYYAFMGYDFLASIFGFSVIN